MDTCDKNRWELSKRNYYFYNKLTQGIDCYRIYDIVTKGNIVIFKGVKNNRAVTFKLNKRYIEVLNVCSTMNKSYSRKSRSIQYVLKGSWFRKWLGRRQIHKMNLININ